MSNNKNNSEVSLGLIIFFMIFIPPVGVLLLLVKIFQLLSGNRLGRKNRYSSYEKKGDEIFKEIWNDASKTEQETKTSSVKTDKSAKTKKTEKNKIPYKTASTVLLIIAGILVFTGLADGIPNLFEYGASAISNADFGGAMACLGIGGILGGVGFHLRHKMKMIKKYMSVIGKRGLVKIDELAKAFSVSRSKVKKELQSVIDSGVFGEYAYIDLGNNLFLRDSSFKPKEEEAPKAESKRADFGEDSYGQTLYRIRELNDKIDDVQVSERIDNIEKYTRQIFEYVKKNPDREKDVHLFMTYYLPTTLKLLESYSEIERVGVAGDNMKSAKDNIEKTLDLLVEAYKKLLDQLYQSENMDISSDIDVLEQMMKKDGLTGNGFGI